jgi:hypothetical protein
LEVVGIQWLIEVERVQEVRLVDYGFERKECEVAVQVGSGEVATVSPPQLEVSCEGRGANHSVFQQALAEDELDFLAYCLAYLTADNPEEWVVVEVAEVTEDKIDDLLG